MSSKERTRMAMARGCPDRVPLMCQLALGHYFLHAGSDPVEIWHDSEAFAEALVTLQRRYGFDGILVNLPGRDPEWRRSVRTVEAVDAMPGGQCVRWMTGEVTLVPADESPRVTGPDGLRRRPRFEEVDPGRLFYFEPHDLPGSRDPGCETFPPWQDRTLRRVRELAGPEVSVHAEMFSPLSQMLEMVDPEDGLMALALDEGKVRAVLDRFCEGSVALARHYADAGCDAVLVSSAFAGAAFLSRARYEVLELPYLRRIAAGVREAHPDLPVYVHTCGALGDRLDLILASGMDGIDTLDPPPLGTVDLRDAMRQLGGRLFVKGNLDPVGTLLLGTPESVRASVRARLEIAGRGGGYILSTACSVPPGAPPENVLMLRSALDEWSADA